jgi:hypothetical protein
VALLQGRPWLPYQRYIAEVAGEQMPDGTYAYPVVVLTMPRQSAKTTTAYDVALGRGRAYRDYRCRYSTHKGTITSDRFVDWFLELERTPALLPQMKLRRSRGTEAVGWVRTGSYFQAFPASDGALRSAALDLVIVDEGQEHDDVLGAALKKMITATFNTRPRRQLWVIFSAGTDASTYAAEYLARGVAGAPGVAVFDYGCPEDVDPLDRGMWHTWHPGLAYGLTSYAALDMALGEGEAAFVREYGNIWTRTSAGPVIDPVAWGRVATTTDMYPGPVCLGVDVAADRQSSTIALAGPNGHVEVLEHAAGVEWVADRVAELRRMFGAPIALDSKGPVGTVLDDLEVAGLTRVTAKNPYGDLLVMDADDVANAAAGFLDAVEHGTVAVWPHPDLDAAVVAAVKRPLGDAGFGWSRRASAATIAPLVAVCAARWGWTRLPPDRPRASAVI